MPEHVLNFAVLDGPDPATWPPWGNGAPNFGAMAARCRAIVMPPAGALLAQYCQARLDPNLVAFDKVLADAKSHLIVGAIVDAVHDPADLAYFTERHDDLMRLGFAITKAAAGTVIPSRKIGFELWIVIDGAHRAAMDDWGAKARTILKERLRTDVSLRYLWSEQFLEVFVDTYLTRAVDRLLEGAD